MCTLHVGLGLTLVDYTRTLTENSSSETTLHSLQKVVLVSDLTGHPVPSPVYMPISGSEN